MLDSGNTEIPASTNKQAWEPSEHQTYQVTWRQLDQIKRFAGINSKRPRLPSADQEIVSGCSAVARGSSCDSHGSPLRGTTSIYQQLIVMHGLFQSHQHHLCGWLFWTVQIDQLVCLVCWCVCLCHRCIILCVYLVTGNYLNHERVRFESCPSQLLCI